MKSTCRQRGIKWVTKFFQKNKKNLSSPLLKKAATILLLIIFLFNTIGYKWVMNYFIDSNDKAFVAALDNEEYDESSLITISVALDLPYSTDWKDFERVDGEIMVNGHIYKYVKRKFEKGSMILKCLPDDNKMHLQTAKADFFKLANDLVNGKESQGKKQNTAVFKLLLTDFELTRQNLFSNYNETARLKSFVYPSFSLLKGSASLPEQPPENFTV